MNYRENDGIGFFLICAVLLLTYLPVLRRLLWNCIELASYGLYWGC